MLGPFPSHAYARDGTYTVTLTVQDIGGQIASTARSLSIDEPPTAKLSVRTRRLRARSLISFSASASRDPDGSIRAYNWRFGDGHSGHGAAVKHSYRHSGHYTVSLTVVDRSGQLASTSSRIRVARKS
jgi:PKD repeat protein